MDDRLRLITAPPPLKMHDLFADVHWSHVIFLTYSFDLPFFESYLLPKLVRNGSCAIAVVADAAQLAENLPNWLEAGDVREAGRSYILCSAHVPGAFHPKLMLAANEQVGTVLLGSGNLSTFGMTTGGELFTYETWAAATIPALAQQAWALCRQLGRRVPIDPLFAEHVETMGRHIPKLALSADGPLLHNLDQPLLDQFLHLLSNREVREILLWAPFTDRRLRALQAIVEQCQPHSVTLALQPEHTSLDGARLNELVAAYPNVRWDFVELNQPGNALIHAKGILVTLTNGEEWLLTGSPNMSAPALQKTVADGNFELAHCIRGRNLRAKLFPDDGQVVLGGVVLPDNLHWKEQQDLTPSLGEVDQFVQLLGATWDGRILRLTVRGVVSPDAQALIDSESSLPIAHLQDGIIVQGVGDRAPTSVALHWNGSRTAPVIVSNLHQLQAAIGRSQSAGLIPLEALNYGDEGEIIQLLEQLAQMTITTRHDIARMMRGAGSATERDETDEVEERAPRVDLSAIDFSGVRQHPRASVYEQRGAGGFDAPAIQVWLDEIVRQFDILREQQLRLITTPVASDDDETDDEVAPAVRPRWAISRRIRVRIRNRIRRYILGLGDPEFWRLVGPDWMAINYSLFLQVLHMLWERLREPPTAILALEDLADLTADMIAGFWGCDDRLGYWARLSENDRIEVGLHLLDRHSDSLTLAMVERLLTLSGAYQQQAPFIAAGVARALTSLGLLTDAAAEQALAYLDLPEKDPRGLRAKIAATTTYFTWHRFCEVLAKRYHVSRVSLRENLFDQGATLVINDKALLDAHPDVLAVFSAWIIEEQRQKPSRRIFQMLWNTEEHVLIYNHLRRDLMWRRISAQGRREFITVAQDIEPAVFASWTTLSPPLTTDVRKTG